MTKYLNDPREETLRTDSGLGYYLEEDNRDEQMYRWGAKILDLCDLPVDEYMKPMTVIGLGGGGGDSSGSTITFSLKYYVNGSIVHSVTLESGDTIPAFSVEEEGYDVTEWKDANGNTHETMPNQNLKLYCNKTVKSFTVRFIVEESGSEDVVISAYTVSYNNHATPVPSPTKTGYEFSGWNPNTNLPITGNTDFIGSFTIKTYIVTWNINGQSVTEEYEYGATINYPSVDIEGYTFNGWDSDVETMPSNDLTITANLSPNSYVLSFYNENQLITSSLTPYKQIITSYPAMENIVSGGVVYNFVWSGNSLIGTEMPAHDVDITGYYTVSDVNGTLYYGIKYNSEMSNLNNIESGMTILDIFNHDSEDGINIPVPTVQDLGLEEEFEEKYLEDDEFTRNWDNTYAYSIVMIIPIDREITEFRQGSLSGPNWVGTGSETDYGTMTINNKSYKIFGYRADGSSYVVNDSPAPKKIYFTIE